MSALDALTPDEVAEYVEGREHRRLQRALVERGLWEIVRYGLIRTIAIPRPVAGAEWSVTVPAGATWRLITAEYRFVTSAVAGTRASRLAVTDQDGNLVAIMPPALTQAATITVNYIFDTSYGATTQIAAANSGAPVTDQPLKSGYTLGSSTANFDAGDQYSIIFVTVEEWTPTRLAQACRNALADLDSAGGIRYVT